MKIWGCAATADTDRTGERLHIEGMDISDIRLFNDEHQSDNMFQILGSIQRAKKIFKEADCEDDLQRRGWAALKKPFLFVEGEIADEQGHPNAQAAAALIKYGVQNPDFSVGLSVEGMTVERNGSDLIKTKVRNVSLTVRPANPNTFVLPVNDLAKSFGPVSLPEQYRDVAGRKAFKNIPTPENLLLAKSEYLKDLKALLKSDPATVDGIAVMKCWSCGQGKLFMKSRLPNRCTACSEPFTMSDIYKARTYKSPF